VQPKSRFVRDIAGSVRTKIVSCGHFPIRAAKIQSVRAIGRSVRGNFPSVRAKINSCGHFSIRAEFLRVFSGQKATIKAN
jgi:hypothetical protein